MINEEEQRYQAADSNQKRKLEQIEQERSIMTQEIVTLQQLISNRNELSSKIKREITNVDIEKEQLALALKRDEYKLETKKMELDQVSQKVDLQKSFMRGKSQMSKRDDAMARSSKTFVGGELHSIANDFDVIDPEDLDNCTKTLGSQSVGGRNSYKQVMRMKDAQEPDESFDYDDEVADNPGDLPM